MIAYFLCVSAGIIVGNTLFIKKWKLVKQLFATTDCI